MTNEAVKVYSKFRILFGLSPRKYNASNNDEKVFRESIKIKYPL